MKNYIQKSYNENGNILYYDKKGEFHRTDGPACEFADGSKQWCIHGKIHRIDGPAVVYSNEFIKRFRLYRCNSEWYVAGCSISENQIDKLQNLRKTINDDDLLNMLLLSRKIIL